MFIQTEQTPNPATLKFVPGIAVMDRGTADFSTREDATRSPLASRLYDVDGVCAVFFGGDFITVTKTDDVDWTLMKPAILGAITEHFMSGQPLLNADARTSGHAESDDDDELVTQTKNCWIRGCAPPSPKTAATSCFMVSSAALSTCACRVPARAVLARPRL